MKHHWKGLTPNPSKYFGFTYVINELSTSKYYVGKKQFWISSGKVKKGSLRPNKLGAAWNPLHWKESKWGSYTGSSKELNILIKANPKDFHYMIIGQYTCKADLVYAECKAQFDYSVMVARDEKGDRISYNKQIAAIRFMPPWKDREEL